MCLWPLRVGRREKTPTPQDKIQHLDFTKDPRPLLLQDPLPVHFATKMSVARPFSVLSENEIGPLVIRAVFLVRLTSWGWGVFPPLSSIGTANR